MKTFLTQTLPVIVAIAILGSFLIRWLDYENAFIAGYAQGQIDQAAIQSELRKGICK